jgi:hypothetical protein
MAKEGFATNIIALRNAGANVTVDDVAAFILLGEALSPLAKQGVP